MSKSIARKLSFTIIIAVMFCTLSIGIISFIFFRNASIDSNAQRALNIAQSAAAIVNSSDFTQIIDTLEKKRQLVSCQTGAGQSKNRHRCSFPLCT